jgi:hypothetical protein
VVTEAKSLMQTEITPELVAGILAKRRVLVDLTGTDPGTRTSRFSLSNVSEENNPILHCSTPASAVAPLQPAVALRVREVLSIPRDMATIPPNLVQWF